VSQPARRAGRGEGVDGFDIGQRVAWVCAPGSYAEKIAIPAASLVPIPDGIDDTIAEGKLRVHIGGLSAGRCRQGPLRHGQPHGRATLGFSQKGGCHAQAQRGEVVIDPARAGTTSPAWRSRLSPLRTSVDHPIAWLLRRGLRAFLAPDAAAFLVSASAPAWHCIWRRTLSCRASSALRRLRAARAAEYATKSVLMA
jgi:hypothetical protein